MKKARGGRPRKAVKRDQQLAVMCTLVERTIIRSYARSARLTISEYLRETGLKKKASVKKRALPEEVLQLTGNLNHIAANLNQIARKRNRGDELDIVARANLNLLCRELKALAQHIKDHLK